MVLAMALIILLVEKAWVLSVVHGMPVWVGELLVVIIPILDEQLLVIV